MPPFPVYKIEIWQNAALLHTIENAVQSIRVKEFETENVGTFSFVLPTKLGTSYKYNDVNVGDTAKIWLGYDSVSGDALTIGKIYQISAPFTLGSGYVRVFSGKNQGEVLQRRFKTKRWEATEASTIVTELANDLGLGTSKIEATSGKSVTLQVLDKKYWDIISFISDYWISGGNEISKGFYVDVDNDLVWKDRPFRTAGVESFTVGDNIISYNVTRDMTQLYNKITVYGAQEKPNNSDKDYYSEATANGHTWSAPEGGTVSTNADSVLGVNSIEITEAASTVLVLRLSLEARKSARFKKDFQTFNFNIKVTGGTTVGTIAVRIYNPVMTNYFNRILLPDHHGVVQGGDWKGFTLGIGKKYEDANGGYNTTWQPNGSPNWKDMNTVEFRIGFTTSGTQTALVDAVYFGEARFSDTAEDSSSQTSYGIKELMIIDDNLRADSECENLAEQLIDLYKDPATQIELFTPGNTNVLVGDRINMTLPAENISAVNYDVFQVEHFFSEAGGFVTKVVMNSNSKQRRKIPTNIQDLTVQTAQLTKEALMVKRVLS